MIWHNHRQKKFFFEEEGYYKSVRIAYSYSTTYIEYESNGDENKTLSTNTRIL